MFNGKDDSERYFSVLNYLEIDQTIVPLPPPVEKISNFQGYVECYDIDGEVCMIIRLKDNQNIMRGDCIFTNNDDEEIEA